MKNNFFVGILALLALILFAIGMLQSSYPVWMAVGFIGFVAFILFIGRLVLNYMKRN
ncbi:hypothetical protein GKZ89_11810 [Bacillus mangrovi]|uniref:Uncharacterized protein n=1 Tax=Metabacillus mangrovi TaxID=1491830 RepID=A0A7X2S5X3_9BACI|nr:hypothetical protein [Metabacillus mangrovi]MTH54095.1 hypothetical protein [Metabacillus mangrovi]